MRRCTRLFPAVIALTLGATTLHAQAASTIAPPDRPRRDVTKSDTSGTAPRETVAEPAEPELSVPLGAAAGLASKAQDAGKAAAIVGFQYAKEDDKLFNAFFNFAGSTTVTGNRSAYGSALLNPSIEGLSFTSTYLQLRDSLGGPRSPLVGVFSELAVAFTTWRPDTTKPGVSGFILVFTPGIEFSTRTMRGSDNNSYQAGIDLGPTFRFVGGNLRQGSADAFRADTAVLGDKRRNFVGLAVTGWIRLNSVQPFIRVTHFGGTEIPSFTGLQAFMGVKALSPIFRTPAQ